MLWQDPVTKIPRIGPRQAEKLAQFPIKTIGDLVSFPPRRYLDLRQIQPLAAIKKKPLNKEFIIIQARIENLQRRWTQRGKQYLQAKLEDDTASIKALWWNQPWLARALRRGEEYIFWGYCQSFFNQIFLTNPFFLEGEEKNEAKIIPFYPEKPGLTSKWLRGRIAAALSLLGFDAEVELEQDPEYLPPSWRRQYHLLSLSQTYYLLHFPRQHSDLAAVRRRLAFDELFRWQLKSYRRRQRWQQHRAPLQIDLSRLRQPLQQQLQQLPFSLTTAQKRSLEQILHDLSQPYPMNRLLQGDVGSGKTVVAALAAWAIARSGGQTLLMAPTTILAQQHYQSLQKLLPLSLTLITRQQHPTPQQIREADLIIGTHALFQEKINFPRVALVIIDEQHRFGVRQRARLAQKAVAGFPHILSLSATPIPRSIALVFYGDQDLSLIDELPPGRQPVKTWLVPAHKRERAWRWLEEKIKQGHQLLVVCPFIQPSTKAQLQAIKAATVEFERLRQKFPHLRWGLLHGQMKEQEKTALIKKMADGELEALVTTTVVEVGLDLPRANLMVIEGAERFGLATLHQLRGRIGRRGEQGYCLLFTSKSSAKENQRLQALQKYHQGQKLAEIDLQLRGPGNLFGTAQHGFKQLRWASLNDWQLIQQVRQAVVKYLEKNAHYRGQG